MAVTTVHHLSATAAVQLISRVASATPFVMEGSHNNHGNNTSIISRWCRELTGRAAYAVDQRSSQLVSIVYLAPWRISCEVACDQQMQPLLCGLSPPLPSPWLLDCACGDKSHRWARSAGLSIEIGRKRVRTACALIYLILNKRTSSILPGAIITAARLLVDGHSRSAWRNVDPVVYQEFAPDVPLTSSSASPRTVLQNLPRARLPSR